MSADAVIERLDELRDRMKRLDALHGSIIQIIGAAQSVAEILTIELALVKAMNVQEGMTCPPPTPRH